MALGNVTVNNLNLAQGSFDEIERRFLFIGVAPGSTGAILSIDNDTDLDSLLGEAESELKTQIAAARLNGGQGWSCIAAPILAGVDWASAYDIVLTQRTFEAVILTTPVADLAAISRLQIVATQAENQSGRKLFFIAAIAGIDTLTQTWAEYTTTIQAIVTGFVGHRVVAVPQLHSNDLGALAGRLANRAASIADSPMRVETGPVLGLGEPPVDINGLLLPEASLAAFDSFRYSVTQRYPDFPGTYFGDANTFDAPAGDFQVLENLRVVDKAARRIRILAIKRVANRILNSTPNSIVTHKNYFTRPLREMARSIEFNGFVFPGEIEPPEDNAIVIQWQSNTHVEIFLKIKPFNSPKNITANIILDLSNG